MPSTSSSSTSTPSSGSPTLNGKGSGSGTTDSPPKVADDGADPTGAVISAAAHGHSVLFALCAAKKAPLAPELKQELVSLLARCDPQGAALSQYYPSWLSGLSACFGFACPGRWSATYLSDNPQVPRQVPRCS